MLPPSRIEGDSRRDLGQTSPMADDRRSGVAAGAAAYGLWGVFPLVFRLLDDVAPIEILLHRIVWSFVVVLVVLGVRGRLGELWAVARDPRKAGLLAVAAALISVNWLTYIWAVNDDRVLDAALGYYINPLLTVGLGVFVLGESLTRAQKLALSLGGAAALVLTVSYGAPPWAALCLAFTFAAYGYVKKAVDVAAVPSLAAETAVLVPLALVGFTIIGGAGDLAFTNGPVGRDSVLLSLGLVTAIPLLLFATAARRIPLSLIGLLQYLAPTLQFLVAVLVVGEELDAARWAGFVLIWLALVVLSSDAVRRLRRRPQPHAATAPV